MKMKKYIIIAPLIWFFSCEDNDNNTTYIKDTGIIINEINYNSSELFNPSDWIEIYNNSIEIIDLSLWQLKDENDEHIFIIPSQTILLPDEYLIFCKDTLKFINCFPSVTKLIGNLGFGLGGGGDMIRLYDSSESLVDIVNYDDDDPWPILADGSGPTLELKNPNLDNETSENWSASENYGTPGEANSSLINN